MTRNPADQSSTRRRFWLVILLLAASPGFAQQGTGNRYRVTTKMEMVGMPFAMPARTSEVCGPKNGSGQAMVPHQDNCQVLDYKIIGTRSSFRMVCTGREAMTGTGEFEMLGSDGYRGKITVDVQGQQMLMNFDGKRIGDCNYATESPQAQGQAMVAKSCDQILAQPADVLALSGASFANGALCAAKKPVYCGKILPLSNDLKVIRNLDATDASMRQSGLTTGGPWESYKTCGMGRDAVLAKACPKAQASGDYEFIGALCPSMVASSCAKADPNRNADFLLDHCAVRAQQLAAANCVARSFTSSGVSGFGEFCNKYAAHRLQQRNGNR